MPYVLVANRIQSLGYGLGAIGAAPCLIDFGLSLVDAVAKLHGATLALDDNRPGLKVSLGFRAPRADKESGRLIKLSDHRLRDVRESAHDPRPAALRRID